MPRASTDQSRAVLRTRLEARRSEIEQAALTRVRAVSEPSEDAATRYAQGLRAGISAGLDYGLAAIERGEQRAPPVPQLFLSQARLAARRAISLDTLLRRYVACYSILGDFLVEEAEAGELPRGRALQLLLRSQATQFERVLAAVSEEYTREADARVVSADERRAQRVRGLLAGELLDTSELEYDLDSHHIALLATGQGAEPALRHFSASLDRRLLLICAGEGTVWAWLGGRRPLDSAELKRQIGAESPQQLFLTIGEPAQGLPGWRLSHRQARAALPVALRGSEQVILYREVALLASILQDDLLATSLRQFYLAPLEQERDGGEALRKTLRAYFAADRNASSAAAALGVSRQAVAKRLRTVEEKVGRTLGSCGVELEAALRIGGFSDPGNSRPARS